MNLGFNIGILTINIAAVFSTVIRFSVTEERRVHRLSNPIPDFRGWHSNGCKLLLTTISSPTLSMVTLNGFPTERLLCFNALKYKVY